MGVAAYNRGTQLIRNQTDRDMVEIVRHTSAGWENLATTRAAVIESLSGDLAKARRVVALLRAEKACLREQLAEARQETSRWKAMAIQMSHAASRLRQSWIKASALLRKLSPEQVQALREL